MLDGLLIPLISPALGLLQALLQRFEQTTHMSRVVADPELPSDHYSHPLALPYLSPKAVDLGSPFQKLGHLGTLLLAQARPCSRSGSAPQSLYSSAIASPLHPLAYRPLADAKGLGYALLGPPLLFEFEGSQTPSLAPVGGFSRK